MTTVVVEIRRSVYKRMLNILHRDYHVYGSIERMIGEGAVKNEPDGPAYYAYKAVERVSLTIGMENTHGCQNGVQWVVIPD